VFTKAASLVQLNPVYTLTTYYLKIHFNIILPSTHSVRIFHLHNACYVPCTSSSIITHNILCGEEYKLLNFSIPMFLPLIGPNFLGTLSSDTPHLSSFPKIRDTVTRPYKTMGKITVLPILMFRFLHGRLKDK
jgi:hypothetical protein